jgi:hypothetical protein
LERGVDVLVTDRGEDLGIVSFSFEGSAANAKERGVAGDVRREGLHPYLQLGIVGLRIESHRAGDKRAEIKGRARENMVADEKDGLPRAHVERTLKGRLPVRLVHPFSISHVRRHLRGSARRCEHNRRCFKHDSELPFSRREAVWCIDKP